MGFVETKMINSDFLNEPINHLNYIESIENHGSSSYIFCDDEISKKRRHDFVAKSSILFAHKQTHQALLEKLTDDDWYYFFKGNPRAGDCLNMLLGVTCFSSGNFNDICEYMNMASINTMPDSILHGFGTLIEEYLESDNAISWINERFAVDLSEYEDIPAVIASSDGWKKILENNSLMSSITTSQWFTKKVVETRQMRIWRLSTQDYYDDDGTHYTTEGTTDGKNITPDALELMKTNNLVTEDYLTITDSAYQRLTDALYWFAQNESVTALKNCKDILSIFCNDEKCCKFLTEHTDILADCLDDRAFASAIFNSTLARDTINSSDGAKNVFNTFITNIQSSNTTLNGISSDFTTITNAIKTVYDTDGLKDTTSPLSTELSEMNIVINDYKSYISVMNNLINLISSTDAEFFANLLNDSSFVTWALNDEAFVNTMIDNEMMSTALCANNGAWTSACNSQTYSNGLQGSEIALNAMLANETARNTAISSKTSMDTMSVSNYAMSRLVVDSNALSKIISTQSALSSVVGSTTAINNILNNGTSLSTVINDSTAMNAISGSSVAMNIISNHDNAMNGIVNSQVAMSSIVSQWTSIDAIIGSTKAMNYIVSTNIAMSTCAGNSSFLSHLVENNNAANIWISSSTGMNYLESVELCRNYFVSSTTSMTLIANNQSIMAYVSNSTYIMNAVAASSVAMNAVAASSVAIGAIASSTTAKNAVLASSTALNALDNSPLAKTMSSAGTVNGKGFVISYSVQSNVSESGMCRGGYTVTVDSTNVATCTADRNPNGGGLRNKTATGSHLFFTSKIALAFTTGTITSYIATGSGEMKYILVS